jgi:hypothetical protein
MFENVDRKKLFFVAAAILGVVVLVWVLYLVWRPTGEVPPSPNDNVPTGPRPGLPATNGNVNYGGVNLPTGGTNVNAPGGTPGEELPPGGGVTPPTGQAVPTAAIVTSGPAISPQAGEGAQVRYYDPRDCKFYEQIGSRRQQLGQAEYCGLQTATWGKSGSQAILEFPDSANIMYDFVNNKQYTLPREITAFSFSPDGQTIAGKYMSDNAADRWIVTVNPDGTGLEGIEPMGDNADRVQVEWAPNNQVIALSTTGEAAGLFQQQVLLIGFNGENFRSLTIDGRGFTAHWTPDGKRLLYSVYSDTTGYRPTLWLVDASTDRVGANKQSLGLATWIDKCTLSDKLAYCAVPLELPEGVAFSRDLANGLPDAIWSIDLATGATALVVEPKNEQGTSLTATGLTLSGDGKLLYFTDAATGQLRDIKLSQ